MSEYYNKRCNHNYYAAVRKLLESYGKKISILDIGPADTPVATWGNFVFRYAIDRDMQPELRKVTAIKASWPEGEYHFPGGIEVITCLQVIEHINEVKSFVKAIFRTATYRVILSIPYKWDAGTCKTHVNDPVDECKLKLWTEREPDAFEIITDG